MNKIYSSWTVVALNLDNNKEVTDKFTACNKQEAIQSFNACYRHARYKIIEVVEGKQYE